MGLLSTSSPTSSIYQTIFDNILRGRKIDKMPQTDERRGRIEGIYRGFCSDGWTDDYISYTFGIQNVVQVE